MASTEAVAPPPATIAAKQEEVMVAKPPSLAQSPETRLQARLEQLQTEEKQLRVMLSPDGDIPVVRRRSTSAASTAAIQQLTAAIQQLEASQQATRRHFDEQLRLLRVEMQQRPPADEPPRESVLQAHTERLEAQLQALREDVRRVARGATDNRATAKYGEKNLKRIIRYAFESECSNVRVAASRSLLLLANPHARAPVSLCCAEYDEDSNGQLDVAELGKALAELTSTQPSLSTVSEAMARHDRDGDGQLNAIEAQVQDQTRELLPIPHASGLVCLAALKIIHFAPVGPAGANTAPPPSISLDLSPCLLL